MNIENVLENSLILEYKDSYEKLMLNSVAFFLA
jgi:hypothetical protein